ncbi:Polyamine-modulated factor [Apis cerana cerana]|uniref:Polyamine-modulated factor n=1 Tax=Apis cerana cerana TaxID=94128 RepID=A0A2A3ESM7_APICC|nr:Polyamine-modulated factor [Apis cerana cerana]
MEEDREQQHPNNIFLFQLGVSNSFKCIAESVSEDAFIKILTILKSKRNIGQKLYKAMCKELFDNMNDDLEDILNEGSLKNGLERIAKLLDEDGSMVEDTWRPPGNVSLHLRSLDAQKIKEESELLEKRVNEIEEENKILMEKIAEKRSNIVTMNDTITESINKSQIAINSLEERMEVLQKCLILLDNE